MAKAVAAAEDAAASGERNSEIWLSRKTIELARLRELVALIDDDTIGEGAVLRLNGALGDAPALDVRDGAEDMGEHGPADCARDRGAPQR